MRAGYVFEGVTWCPASVQREALEGLGLDRVIHDVAPSRDKRDALVAGLAPGDAVVIAARPVLACGGRDRRAVLAALAERDALVEIPGVAAIWCSDPEAVAVFLRLASREARAANARRVGHRGGRPAKARPTGAALDVVRLLWHDRAVPVERVLAEAVRRGGDPTLTRKDLRETFGPREAGEEEAVWAG